MTLGETLKCFYRLVKDASVNTKFNGADLELLEKQFREAEKKLQELEEECVDLKQKQHFCLGSISENAVFLSNLHILLQLL